MRKKLLRIILIVLGVLGFFLGNRAIYLSDIGDPAWFTTCLIAIMLLAVVWIGMSFYNRLGLSPPVPEYERKRRKRLGLVI